MRPNKLLFLLLFSTTTLLSCFTQNEKETELLYRIDSLSRININITQQLEEAFTTLNEVEEGLASIREAEKIITFTSSPDQELTLSEREKFKNDIEVISAAIEGYKKQLERLKRESKIESQQFFKRIEALSEELEEKSLLIIKLESELRERDKVLADRTEQLRAKSVQIASLDRTIQTLKDDISSLHRDREKQREQILTQEELINTGFYIFGTKEELIEQKVVTRGGLFKSARVSYEADHSAFVKIDIREITKIELNSRRAKILSIHPKESYQIEESSEGELSLLILSPHRFWEQTKYLVIQLR